MPNKIKLNGVKLVHQSEIKYVGIVFDEFLTFKSQINNMNTKLKRANNLISISRHYIPKNLLSQIYYGQFFSHLNYGCQLWRQNPNQLEQTQILQKKAARKISFAHYQANSDPLLKNLRFLKVKDITKMNNIMFVHSTLNNKIPQHFKNFFETKQNNHSHYTRNMASSTFSFPIGSIEIPEVRLESSKTQIKYACAKDWNEFLKTMLNKYPDKSSEWLQNLSPITLKQMIKDSLIETY